MKTAVSTMAAAEIGEIDRRVKRDRAAKILTGQLRGLPGEVFNCLRAAISKNVFNFV